MKLIFLLGMFLFVSNTSASAHYYSADTLFEKFSRSIFQIKIIDIHSSSQSSIGTGFIVKNDSLLVTNYHVISALIDKPEQYRAEITIDNQPIALEIVSFDVVNDLALLSASNVDVLGESIPLSSEQLSKGKTLYSIGNPHDIGMTVVEGTYNGLVEHRFLDSIHFSGSINPGMSGGPTINTKGEVVGINVATSGDQIGFLVPVDKLQQLLLTTDENQGQDHFERIEQQVTHFSNRMMDEVLSLEWPLESMGDGKVIGHISHKLECWGNSRKEDKVKLNTISKGCNNTDRIYINPSFNVGFIEYQFNFYQASDWNSITFYQYITQQISGARAGNRANKESVNNYICSAKVLKKEGDSFKKKVNYCIRSYKKIKNLYDVFYLATSIDKKNAAIFEHYTLSGVTQLSAKRFLSRFIGALSWQ